VARDIGKRLDDLQSRRHGTDARSYARLNEAARLDAMLAKVLKTETWQKRASAQPHTRYALGAMQAVDPDYTRISIETAERVEKQLAAKLSIPVGFRLQGSVPLDVHIRGASDVDLLTLDTSFYTYATYGRRSLSGYYTTTTSRTSLGVLLELRRQIESALKAAYPAATVDCSGGKCVAISGGSLARPVDVVPAHWWDTCDYQETGLERDRGVTILNKKVPEPLDNLPFLHIRRIHERDGASLGGLKKAIRLTKNVKNDAENEGSAANLPSFDIAALLYHADQDALRAGFTYELTILRETQRFLDWCYANQAAAKQLRTPDGSRTILDSDAKMTGLLTISCEMDSLAKAVAKEHSLALQAIEPSWTQVDEALRKAYIPKAA
jgi:hypothetical protein